MDSAAGLRSLDAGLEDLAAGLQDTFPAREDAPLARCLLRLLAHGRPVGMSALADAAGLDEAGAARSLDRWPNVEHDATGRVIAFAGLTLRTTTHRLSVGGRQLHTWCAWDTLFLPALLEMPAYVRSRCPVTGADVELELTTKRVRRTKPEQLLVTFPSLATTDTADITESFCGHVHFLAGAGAAERWRERHPESMTLDLAVAYELGQRTVEPLLRAGRA